MAEECTRATHESEMQLHTPSGATLQLLSIVQRPGACVAHQLRMCVLRVAHSDDTIERVCAVARCRWDLLPVAVASVRANLKASGECIVRRVMAKSSKVSGDNRGLVPVVS